RHTRFSRDWSSDVCSSDLERFAELSLPELYRRAQGWVAGAILLLEQSGAAPAPAPVVGDPLVFDYFAGEIFDRTDGRMQAFLVQIGGASGRARVGAAGRAG